MHKISDFIYKISAVFIIFALAIIVILVFAQVVSRYVLNFSISWSQEITTYLMIWMLFIGCSMGLRQGEIVALNSLVDRLPKRISLWCSVTVDVSLIVFLVIGVYFNFSIINLTMHQRSPILSIPMGWVSLSFTVAGILMIFYSLIHIHSTFKEICLIDEN